jgi:hypothetical protein
MSDNPQSPLKKLLSAASRVVGGLVSKGSSSSSNDEESSPPGLEQSSLSSASTVQQSGVQAAVTLDECQMSYASAVQKSRVSAVSTLDLNQCAGSLAASSLSSDGTLTLASKTKVTVPRTLLPIAREGINREWVIQHWSVVRQWISLGLGAYLPENEPEEKHVTTVTQELQGCYDYTCRRLDENLLMHLQALLWKHNLASSENVPKSVKQIHILVLESAKEYSEVYLHRVLEFLKLPHRQERGWLDRAILEVTEKYGIQFDPAGKEKNFVEAIAERRFNDLHNQRLRRMMVKNVGVAFYDRVPRMKGLDTLFGANIDVSIENLGVFVVADNLMRGHIAKRVGNKSPTGCEQVSVETLKLNQALSESKTEEEVARIAVEIWKTNKEVRCFILIVSFDCATPLLLTRFQCITGSSGQGF